MPASTLKTLISKEYAATRRKEIDPAHAAAIVQAGVMSARQRSQQSPRRGDFTGRDRGDTIYMTAADGRGNIVSLIQSLFSRLRIRAIVAGDTGIVLHNRGSVFNLDAGHPDQIAPHKRPLHTLIPAFVMKDGKPWLSFGVMGGDHQAQGHTQVLVNLIDFGMNVQEAGEAARVTHGSNGLLVESAIPAAGARRAEGSAGTSVDRMTGGAFGGYQGILIDPRTGVLDGRLRSPEGRVWRSGSRASRSKAGAFAGPGPCIPRLCCRSRLSCLDPEPLPQRIAFVHQERVLAGDPGGAFDLGNDRVESPTLRTRRRRGR